MTSDKNTTKIEPTSKAASPPSEGASKLEGNAPSNYSRGEKQKPVTASYKDNWNRLPVNLLRRER